MKPPGAPSEAIEDDITPEPGQLDLEAGDALALDLHGAGGTRAAGHPAEPPPQASPHKRPTETPLPSASAPTGTLAPRSAAALVSPTPGPDRIGLFGGDFVTNVIVAAVIGLLIGILPALSAAGSLLDREMEPLMIELQEAIDRPMAVEDGEIRGPAAIQNDVESALGGVQGRYFTIWLGVALPIAVVLAFIRRRTD